MLGEWKTRGKDHQILFLCWVFVLRLNLCCACYQNSTMQLYLCFSLWLIQVFLWFSLPQYDCFLSPDSHLEMLSPSMLTASIELHSVMQGSRKVDSHVDFRLPKRSTLEYSHFFYFLMIINF